MINDLLKKIKEAIYGEEVRNSIHDAIEQCYKDATGHPESVAATVKEIGEVSANLSKETTDRKAEVSTERKRIDNLIATGTAQTQEIGKKIIQDSSISSSGIVLKGLTNNNYYYKLFEESGSIDSEFCTITNQQGKYTAKLLKPGLYYMNFKVHVEMSGGFSEEVIASLKLFKSNTLDWSTFDVLDAETVEISKTENTSINKKIHFLFRVAEPSYIRIYIDIDTSHTKTITFRIDGCDIIALDWKGKQSANLSELHDLRIGADGVVHNTAGEAVRKQIGNLTEDIGNVADVTGKKINGIFVENNYVSPLALEAGTTYHIFYKSGSKAQFYVAGDVDNFVAVDEGGLYEFTPNISATAKLFRNTVDSKNNIVFYIGTDLTFFRDIRKIEETYVATQAKIEEHSKKIDAVETNVKNLFVEKKITETNDRSTITQTLATNYCIGISNKINSGIKIEKITFGTELAKEPYILFVDTNGLVLRKWTIKSKVLNINYTTEADGFFVFHIIGSGSGFKWKSGATDGSINTLIFQYASLHEAEIAVGENISKPNFNIKAKVWVDCEITITEMNYEAFKDNKYRGKKIAFLGDSITQGLTWNGSAQVYVDKPYPMTVAEKLECICQNVGHSSYPISSIGKAQCFNTTYVEIDRDVDYIFVFGGTNDFQYSVPVGTIADREDVSFCGAIFTLINKIRTRIPNAKLVFFTPLHRSTEVKSDGANLMDYVKAIRDVCELCAIPVVDLYKNSGFSNVVTEMEQYYADGLHLTQDGYNLLGTVISELILVH